MDSIQWRQFVIFSTLFASYSLYVLGRRVFSFTMPQIRHSERLSKEELGAVVSAYNGAYAVSKFVLGVCSDRLAARWLFAGGLAASAAAVLGLSRARHASAFALLSVLNGAAQGCGWPAAAKMLRHWFREDQFGTFWSLLTSSGNLISGVVPLFLPMFLSSIGDWRTFMLACGATSLSAAVVSAVVLRNTPMEAGMAPIRVETVEKSEQKLSAKDHSHSTQWSSLLKSRFLWLIAGYYLVVYAAKTSCENWAQLLLVDERGLSEASAAHFLSSFESGGFLSSISTGFITDWAVRKRASTVSSPRMVISLAYMILGVAAIHVLLASSAWAQACGFLMGVSFYGNINIFGIVATESAPSHLSGSSHALVALAANVGAVAAGLPLSIFADYFGWSGAFRLLEVACFICTLLMVVTRNSPSKIGYKKD